MEEQRQFKIHLTGWERDSEGLHAFNIDPDELKGLVARCQKRNAKIERLTDYEFRVSL